LPDLHGVIDGQSSGNDSTGTIDVHGDVLLRVVRLQKEELGDDQTRLVVVNLWCQF